MGRARKMGKRTAKGRLSRAKDAVFDRGSDRAQERKAQFHGHGYDAVGRAFEAGLLGRDAGRPTARAKMLMDLAQQLFRRYWRHFGIGPVGCTLGRAETGGGKGANEAGIDDGVNDAEQEAWLLRMLAMVPRRERRVFYELVIDINPDTGPIWLDRLIAVKAANLAAAQAANGKEAKQIKPPPADQARLDMVVQLLDAMVG